MNDISDVDIAVRKKQAQPKVERSFLLSKPLRRLDLFQKSIRLPVQTTALTASTANKELDQLTHGIENQSSQSFSCRRPRIGLHVRMYVVFLIL
jgi:hypothetical protein